MICTDMARRCLGSSAARLMLATALLLAGQSAAFAGGRLEAHYRISMTGVTIGYANWAVDLRDSAYTTTASGEAGGIFSILFSGKGTARTDGTAASGRLSPSAFTFKLTDEDGQAEFRVTFKDGTARERVTPDSPPDPERVPVTDKDRRDVLDPLSAVLLTEVAGVEAMAPENCARALKIFDGRRRYDLALSFIRVDRMALERSYTGPALVCQVILRPVAGYNPDSNLVKYVAGRRDMELWFAPVDGTGVLAPLRVAMPTLLGTLKIEADRFESNPGPPRASAPARNGAPR